MELILIQFDHVSLAFLGHFLFKEASFSLQKKERCGLIGRNGSGKTTLFSLINKEIEPDQGSISISKDYKIGHLQQHIHFTEPTIIQEAALGLPPKDQDHLYKAKKILFGLGFTEKDLLLPIDKFSGGFHLRLHLAKVLISEPDCLLLDEPTNYLDILSLRWLTRFLNKWPKEFILISHDRDFMDNVTSHTIGIHREKVRKMKGSSIEYFQQVLLEEETYEKSRLKTEKRRAHLQSYVDRFGAKASKATQAKSKKKRIQKEPILEKLNKLFNLSFSFHEAAFPGKKMLDAKNLQFSYNHTPLIENMSLEIKHGERIAIIGKNGRGKSTLLRLLSLDINPKEGVINLSKNAHIGYFGQTHIERLSQSHTIEEEISLANPQLNFKEVKAISALMMFSGSLSEKKISILSGGEKSRVLLGKIIAKPCNLLLLDEPTHHLDIESIETLIDALEDFSGSIVVVTHSELILRRLSLDKIILCKDKDQTLFSGNYDEFLEKIGLEEEKKASLKKSSSLNTRKERAEFIARRSLLLKPIEKKIHILENKIIPLEKEQKKSQKLIEDDDLSSELLKSFGLRQKQIERLEEELYDLYELLENTKMEFEV